MAKIPRLAPGSTGEMVKAMQHALIANGFSVGTAGADGKFGNQTQTALEAFQDDNALPVQPTCDRACWAALYPEEKNRRRATHDAACRQIALASSASIIATKGPRSL